MKKLSNCLIAAGLVLVIGCSCDSNLDKQVDPQTDIVSTANSAPKPPDMPEAVAKQPENAKKETSCKCECAAASEKKPEENQREKWEKMAQELQTSPFEVSIGSAYLAGECAKGPVPEKRDNTGGIHAELSGRLTYTGDDLLMEATIEGALVIDVHGTHIVEIPFKVDGNHKQPSTGFSRPIRGVDPWVSGQTRDFRIETLSMSEAFCEFVPKSATVYVALNTFGVRDGRKTLPVAAVPMHFDEIIGMALNTQVQLIGDDGFIPAAAHAARLDQLLITQLDGTTKWVPRERVAYLNGLKRGTGAVFPKVLDAGPWKITVNGISSAKKFETVEPKGDDAFLVLVPVSISNTGEEALSIDDIKMRLETAPNEWRKPVDAGFGALDEAKLAAGELLDTTAVFYRNRFERPTRLKLDVDGSGTVYVNVFNYAIGPERSPLQ